MSEPKSLQVDPSLWKDIKFDEKGLIPAIAQEMSTGVVLMLAYMNRESLEQTIKTGYATYWSRSRQKLWKKGESSGHVQAVRGILIDCDQDALVLLIDQTGPACHTNEKSCFYRALAKAGDDGNQTGCGGCGGCCG
ncbi:phosphoribosyl-AMP cyclohydrolase [bacterium]|nr:phosphoribosyl-AMP cyclohydrolase [bacterium]